MPDRRPNILFIMTDDHAAHAMSCYGSRINATPHMDRIAEDGMRLDSCFCTNSICSPSRATILTGQYEHVHGVRTLADNLDRTRTTFATLLRDAGYQTALVGKWHLGTAPENRPRGFDYWTVLPGQGLYHDPLMHEMDPHDPDRGVEKTLQGYVTDVITDIALDWLRRRDRERPFCLLVHHKAPHRHWEPDEKHAAMYDDIEIPPPDTLHDDYQHRATAARIARMRVGEHMNEKDLKRPVPQGLRGRDLREWAYQLYIKDYLRTIASVDDNIGRLLDALDAEGLAEDTVVVYTSDQGFFLGDHGWYDKRFFYEESLRMPLLVRYPREIPAGSTSDAMALNLDFAQTFLDYAGVEAPADMMGRSLRPVLAASTPRDWRTAMYYRYWMHLAHHNVCAHYGVRTHRHKLIYYYGLPLDASGAVDPPMQPEWELFDLDRDPQEMHSVYDRSAYAPTVAELKDELRRLREEVGDLSAPWDA
ncbi:MAG: sulfatase [Candidatus Brocadiia bacterium]